MRQELRVPEVKSRKDFKGGEQSTKTKNEALSLAMEKPEAVQETAVSSKWKRHDGSQPQTG